MVMFRPLVGIFQVRVVRCSAGQYRANAFASKHREATDLSELLQGVKRQKATRWWLQEAFCRSVPVSFQVGDSLRLPFEGLQTEGL